VNGSDMHRGAKLQSFAPHPVQAEHSAKQEEERKNPPPMHRNNNSAGTPTTLVWLRASFVKPDDKKSLVNTVTYPRLHSPQATQHFSRSPKENGHHLNLERKRSPSTTGGAISATLCWPRSL
jgi:hypothetical protein